MLVPPEGMVVATNAFGPNATVCNYVVERRSDILNAKKCVKMHINT